MPDQTAARALRPEDLRPLLALVARQAGASHAVVVCRGLGVAWPDTIAPDAVAALVRALQEPTAAPADLAGLVGASPVSTFGLADGAVALAGGGSVSFDAPVRAACESLCLQLRALAPDPSRLQLEAVIAAASDGITVQRRDGKVLYANDSIARMSGYADGEALKRAPSLEIRERFQLTNEDGAPFDWNTLPGRVAFATGRPAERTVRFRRASGEERMTLLRASPILGPDGEVQFVVNVIVDLTERKRTEDAMRLLAQAGLLWTGLPTLRDGCEALAQLMARTPGWTALLEWPGADGQLQRACAGPDCERPDASSWPMRVEARLSRSGRVALSARAAAVPFGEVEKQLVEELARRLEVAVERERLNEQLANSLRARETLMHAVGHELNNPLALVMLNAEQIARWASQEPAPARICEYCDGITSGVQRMHRLIGELVDFVRAETGKLQLDLEDVPVSALFGDVRRMIDVVAGGAPARLTFHAPADLRVRADRARIAQVLENLVTNALKYAPEGAIEVRAEEQQGEVLFTVSDQGPGIRAADLPHLFEPYWQATDNPRSGLGLGLPICRYLVQAHGAHLWVDSPGQGCTFGFSLPRA